eukprot:10536110-Karenia_brevis.AAC.1
MWRARKCSAVNKSHARGPSGMPSPVLQKSGHREYKCNVSRISSTHIEATLGCCILFQSYLRNS